MDVEGNPYPAGIQRLVPGREQLSDQEVLAPNLALAGPTSPLPPVIAAASARRRSGDRRLSGLQQAEPRASGAGGVGLPASNIDQLIAELAASTTRPRPSTEETETASSPTPLSDLGGGAPPVADPTGDHSYASPPARRYSSGNNIHVVTSPAQPLGSAGAAVAAAAWPSSSLVLSSASSGQLQQSTSSVWRRRNLTAAEGGGFSWRHEQVRRKEMGCRERLLYKVELAKKRPGGGGASAGRHEGLEVTAAIGGKKRRGGAKAGANRRRAGPNNSRPVQERTGARARARQTNELAASSDGGEQEDEEEEEEEEDEEFQQLSSSDTSLDESDLEGSESSSDSSSTEYSDWGANNLTPPQRTARKSGGILCLAVLWT